MTTDFRALCVELTDCLEKADWPLRHRYVFRQWIDIARAALADEPAVPEVVGSEWQPCVKLPITVHVREQRPGEQHVSTREGITPVQSDDLIMLGVDGEEYPIGRELFQRTYRMGSADEPAAVTGQPRPMEEDWDALVNRLWSKYETIGYQGERFMYEGDFCTALDLVRQEIAHWGNPAPAPPADGEVAELVEWLREQLHVCLQAPWTPGIKHFGRAAELLQRQALVPVPVSERLPGPSDCAPWPKDSNASSWCWVGTEQDDGWNWEQRSAGCLAMFPDDFTHWLPAHALPLPEVGE